MQLLVEPARHYALYTIFFYFVQRGKPATRDERTSTPEPHADEDATKDRRKAASHDVRHRLAIQVSLCSSHVGYAAEREIPLTK